MGASTPLGFWGPGPGVRGASGHGTMNIGTDSHGVRGVGVRGASGHGTMNIGTDSHL